MWFGTASNLQKMDINDRRLPVRGVMVEPVEVVRDLGVYFDSRLTMQKRVQYFTHMLLSSAPSAKPQEASWS